jgi:hypothetical protein
MRKWTRRLALAVAASAVTTMALAATGALAVWPDSDVESLAACLNTAGAASGTLTSIAVGDEPAKPCGNNQMLIHLSGGDITKVDTPSTSALQGGTDNGAASLDLKSSYKLPQTCLSGQVAKAGGPNSAWTCAADNDSGGDITGVSAGTGLSGGGTSGNVTLGVAPGFQLPQSCASGSVTKATGSGTWACGSDNDTTYTGANFATSNQSCATGAFANGISAAGSLQCTTPGTPSLQTTIVQSPFVTVCSLTDPTCPASGSGSPNTAAWTAYAEAYCPAGTVVTGGGFQDSDVDVLESKPTNATTWQVRAQGSVLDGGHVRAYATCLSIS